MPDSFNNLLTYKLLFPSPLLKSFIMTNLIHIKFDILHQFTRKFAWFCSC